MNKQQTLEQIDEPKQKIEELEKEVNSPEFEGIKKGARQKPKDGEVYYFLDSAGYVSHTYWTGSEDDLFRFNIGNCFTTEEETNDFKENLLTKQLLKDLALELNKGEKINWEDTNKPKYYITYTNIGYLKELQIYKEYCQQGLSQVYCLGKGFLSVAKQRIGEERLIKLIKSGV